MRNDFESGSRRKFFRIATVMSAGALAASCRSAAGDKAADGADAQEKESVSPNEDLMREHGVLDRVLLIYDEILRRIDPVRDADPAVLRDAAGVIRNFIENYHEKLEEDHLFPRFEKSGKLVDLVHTLREQHLGGRILTDHIEQQSMLLASKDAAERRKLESPIKAFIRMYRPHAAREDTVLFPAFRGLVPPSEYDDLGEAFEDQEQKLFGHEGFQKIVQQVADIERRLGIENLAQFTPKV